MGDAEFYLLAIERKTLLNFIFGNKEGFSGRNCEMEVI